MTAGGNGACGCACRDDGGEAGCGRHAKSESVHRGPPSIRRPRRRMSPCPEKFRKQLGRNPDETQAPSPEYVNGTSAGANGAPTVLIDVSRKVSN
jgi:hypothetical protein